MLVWEISGKFRNFFSEFFQILTRCYEKILIFGAKFKFDYFDYLTWLKIFLLFTKKKRLLITYLLKNYFKVFLKQTSKFWFFSKRSLFTVWNSKSCKFGYWSFDWQTQRVRLRRIRSSWRNDLIPFQKFFARSLFPRNFWV